MRLQEAFDQLGRFTDDPENDPTGEAILEAIVTVKRAVVALKASHAENISEGSDGYRAEKLLLDAARTSTNTRTNTPPLTGWGGGPARRGKPAAPGAAGRDIKTTGNSKGAKP